MRARVSLVMQVLDLILFFTATFTSKETNVLQFIVSCFTGLKMDYDSLIKTIRK